MPGDHLHPISERIQWRRTSILEQRNRFRSASAARGFEKVANRNDAELGQAQVVRRVAGILQGSVRLLTEHDAGNADNQASEQAEHDLL